VSLVGLWISVSPFEPSGGTCGSAFYSGGRTLNSYANNSMTGGSVMGGQLRKRNRKRPQRRKIFCPIHRCYLDSVSQKYPMFADASEQLQARGMERRRALVVMATFTTVPLDGEWLEAFWCGECQRTEWYYVKKLGDRDYEIALAPRELWQQVHGVIDQRGNPSVSQFTLDASRMVGYQGLKQFRFVD
jgi:hypothetical protein